MGYVVLTYVAIDKIYRKKIISFLVISYVSRYQKC
jgi:hypothetical protein